ncbi:hypothetical protein SORBI_3004G216650 [Sorghum bicolor]|uniref:Uncharacterized protein n=1 Tax=Sorghum bicolor TaxID=4558 RepID=A0A1Z5RP00_SORBI|nr:hypothetical protein SORBI_3004G216650 [Sorghum bicolor]
MAASPPLVSDHYAAGAGYRAIGVRVREVPVVTSKRFRRRGRGGGSWGPKTSGPCGMAAISFVLPIGDEWSAMVAAHGAGGPPLHSTLLCVQSLTIRLFAGLGLLRCAGAGGDAKARQPNRQWARAQKRPEMMMLRMRIGQLRCQAHEYYVSTNCGFRFSGQEELWFTLHKIYTVWSSGYAREFSAGTASPAALVAILC